MQDVFQIPVPPQAAGLPAQRAGHPHRRARGAQLYGMGLLCLSMPVSAPVIACPIILPLLHRAQVQINSVQQRSMHPRILSTRKTYVLTSHAETPLCV